MRRAADTTFATVRTEGGLLPSDFLRRLARGDRDVAGLRPEDYHLAEGERLTEAIGRAWARLVPAWAGFKVAVDRTGETDLGTSLTRERWLLVLFQELGYGRLPAARGIEVEGTSYPVSHLWGSTPIHLVGFRVGMDHRTRGAAGAARTSPHGLVQDLLNRSDDYTWGFVGNGMTLRLLRSNASLTRQAYVEFDLESMMDGEVYADFALLWLLAHQSRVELRPGADGEVGDGSQDCWLETWVRFAREQGTRALEDLRRGVETAIAALGAGFISHPANGDLREHLRSGDLSTLDLYREVLRLVYRLIFLFAAEDRDLLLAPDAPLEARERYTRHYSTARLRRLAQVRRGTRHPDLWRMVRLVMDRLGSDEGCPPLALPALGSPLWASSALPHLARCEVANVDLLAAVRALAFLHLEGALRPISYRDLGAEELGGVYESLLDLHPVINVDRGTFELRAASGSERKTSGSYYTPHPLVLSLLDTALDPVLDAAAGARDPAVAILDLKIVDPACGSGHFLVAAAHRIARRLAQARTGDLEPSPAETRAALRAVIGRCLHGVDLNPMAVELCKVGLWLESLEPGRPLSFLEHRILSGNSLLGTTPALIEDGLPDAALDPLVGDEPEVAREAKRRNRDERQGQGMLGLGMVADRTAPEAEVAAGYRRIDSLDDATIASVHAKEQGLADVRESRAYRHAMLRANAWCASFVWPKRRSAPVVPTHADHERLRTDPAALAGPVREAALRLARDYGFFHWHLEFPGVFAVERGPRSEATGWEGGFDVVLGNPPWERIKLQEKEFFAERRPELTEARNAAARKRLIARLETEDPRLWAEWQAALRRAEGESRLVRASARYPLCGRGDINTYSIFAELNRSLMSASGRAGFIVPSGIATDATTQHFFRDLVERADLRSLYDFQSGPGLFAEVGHARFKFCLLTLGSPPSGQEPVVDFAFFMRAAAELTADRRFSLTHEDIVLLNPNTGTCPIFRTRRDAEITKAIYRRVPVLWHESDPEGNPWRVSFRAMLHMANDSGLFRTREDLEAEGWQLEGNVFVRSGGRMLPLYEAKMVHHYDHRFGDYTDKPAGSESTALPRVPVDRLADPAYAPLPRYWVEEREVAARLDGRWDRGWLLGWRDICRSTDVRTVIAAVVPRVGVGHTTPLLMTAAGPTPVAALVANLSSFVFDYSARQKVGGTHLTYSYLKQLPVLDPAGLVALAHWSGAESVAEWLLPRVLELSYTAWDLAPLARDLGWVGPPFRWDEDRRFILRAEIDAAFFHLYGLTRDDLAYVMDTFWIVREADERLYGTYRTKATILEVYDRMTQATASGVAYRTLLDPAPADPAVAHTEALVPERDVAVLRPAARGGAFPDAVPALDPVEQAQLFLWAVLHVSGGARPLPEIAGAFALWMDPDLLARLAPSDLTGTVQAWARHTRARTLPRGAFDSILTDLVERDGLARNMDASGRTMIRVASMTASEGELDPWFRAEARLILTVLDVLSAPQAAELEAVLGGGRDRGVRTGGGDEA